MEWLPKIGEVAAGACIALVIEFLKKMGLPVRYAPLANVILSAIWAGIVAAITTWPGIEPITVAIVTAIYTILGALASYHMVIKPVVNKRWNR